MEKISSVLGEADVDQDHFLVRIISLLFYLWPFDPRMTLIALISLKSKEELMTAIKDFVENIENEIPGLNSYLWDMINFNSMVNSPGTELSA